MFCPNLITTPHADIFTAATIGEEAGWGLGHIRQGFGKRRQSTYCAVPNDGVLAVMAVDPARQAPAAAVAMKSRAAANMT